MLKKTITSTDFNGVERTEDFYFNLTKSEIAEWELSKEGGMSETIRQIVNSQSSPGLMKLFKALILKSYGEKSEDGRRLIKGDAVSEAFSQTAAYDVLFMDLIGDAQKAVSFIKGIMPADMASKIPEDQAELKKLANENNINISK